MLEVVANTASAAPLVVIYGEPKVGKSFFAAHATNPIFVCVENGMIGLTEKELGFKVGCFPYKSINSYEDVIKTFEIVKSKYAGWCKTLVFDSISAFERLIWAKVAKKEGKEDISEIGYFRGYDFALKFWEEFINECLDLASMGITPLLIAHAAIKNIDDPERGGYSRVQIDLNHKAFSLVNKHADVIGYAHWPIYVKKEDSLTIKDKAINKGGRTLRLQGSAAVIAGNRLGMPELINLDWNEFAQYVPFYNQNKNS